MEDRIKDIIYRYFEGKLTEQELSELLLAIERDPLVADFFHETEEREEEFDHFTEHAFRAKMKQIYAYLKPGLPFEDMVDDIYENPSRSETEKQLFISRVRRNRKYRRIAGLGIAAAAAAAIFLFFNLSNNINDNIPDKKGYTVNFYDKGIVLPDDSTTNNPEYNRAVKAFREKNYQEAAAISGELMKTDTSNMSYLFLNGASLALSGSSSQAVARFTSLLNEYHCMDDNMAGFASLYLALYYSERGEGDSAVYYFTKLKGYNYAVE